MNFGGSAVTEALARMGVQVTPVPHTAFTAQTSAAPTAVTPTTGAQVTVAPPPTIPVPLGGAQYYAAPPGYDQMMENKDTLPWYQGPVILVAGLGVVGVLFWMGWRHEHPRQLAGYKRRQRR